MSRSVSFITSVAVLISLAGPAPSEAQAVWDEARYVEISQTGQALFDEAIALPESEETERRALLERASESVKDALGMLTLAMVTGSLEGLRNDALRDYFTLMENLIVIWLHLDHCVPAQHLWDQAMQDPALPARRAADLFEVLTPRLEECRQRVGVWEWSEYAERVDRSRQLWSEAGRGPEADQELLAQASQASSEALEMIRDGVFGGRLGHSPVEDPPQELFVRYDTTIDLLVAQGRCPDAAQVLSQAQLDSSTLAQVDAGRTERSRAALDDCGRVVPAVSAVSGREGPSRGAESPHEGIEFRDALGYALVGSAALMAAALLIVDASTASDRDELDALRDQCSAGPCDYERALRLSDSIDSSKVAAGILLGGAIVAGTAGLVLLLTGDDEPDEDATANVVPMFGAEGVGAVVFVEF